VFGKLFNFKKLPLKKGIFEDSDQKVKVIELELTNMDGSPTYVLSHQLTIGSEIGNIVINDPSISPRHATFALQDDVISLMDHSSVSGTFVNDNKIVPGKSLILDESDEIRIGDLVLKIRVKYEISGKEVAGIEDRKTSDQDFIEGEFLSEELDNLTETQKASKLSEFFKKFKFQKDTKPSAKLEFGLSASYSANSLPRVIALIMDLLLSYSLVVVLMPLEDFQHFIAFIPDLLGEIFGVKPLDLWAGITEDHGWLREIVADILGFVDGLIHLAPLVVVFVVMRLFFTIIFGVSVSQYLLSINPAGNGIWARIGGVIRELIGFVTVPFIIFDVPAVVSRKTFKEFITFTQIQLRSKWVAVLSTLIFLPLFVGFNLVAPLFEGFEPPESIAVSEKIDRRVKVQKTGDGLQANSNLSVTESSKLLRLELSYDPEKILIAPELKFKGIGENLSFTTPVKFYLKDLKRSVSFELLKSFSFQKIVASGMKGNFFLYEKFPELNEFVYSQEMNIGNKGSMDPKDHEAFGKEFINFTKLSLGLSLDNFLEVMQNETPLIKGLLDFRASLLNLLENKNFNQLGFMKIGNLHFLKVSYLDKKPYDLLIPLIKGDGIIYKVEFDKKEKLNEVSSHFYKFTLESANWFSPKNLEMTELPNVFQVLDVLGGLDQKSRTWPLERALKVYGHFYQKSGRVLLSQDPIEHEFWKKTLISMTKLIDSLKPLNQNDQEAQDSILKLKQVFGELDEAFQNKNLEFFGVSST